MPDTLKGTHFMNDIKNHREIRVSCLDKFMLFIHSYLACIYKISCWRKKFHLTRVFQKGKNKIFRDLNVYHMIRRLTQLENVTALQCSQSSNFPQWVHKHSGGNVLNCDHDDQSDHCSSEEYNEHREKIRGWYQKYKDNIKSDLSKTI